MDMFIERQVERSYFAEFTPFCRFIDRALSCNLINLLEVDARTVLERYEAAQLLILRSIANDDVEHAKWNGLQCVVFVIADRNRLFQIARFLDQVHWFSKVLFWDRALVFGKFSAWARGQHSDQDNSNSFLVVRHFEPRRDHKFFDSRIVLRGADTVRAAELVQRLKDVVVGDAGARELYIGIEELAARAGT